MSDIEARILECLMKESKKARDLAITLRLDCSTVNRMLYALEKAGKLQRTTTSPPVWSIAEEGGGFLMKEIIRLLEGMSVEELEMIRNRLR